MPKQITRQTIHLKKRFLENLEKCYGIITAACRMTNIARCTVYDYLKKDKEFADQVSEIRNRNLDLVEDKLIQKIMKGNIAGIIFYLKCQGKHRGWSEKQQMKHSVDRPIIVALQWEKLLEGVNGEP